MSSKPHRTHTTLARQYKLQKNDFPARRRRKLKSFVGRIFPVKCKSVPLTLKNLVERKKKLKKLQEKQEI
jgi:hypothetical protein